ncbi:MAG: helix-turn-helix domain-containing protein [Gammaproteobacteria bacterium]|nr:helix-turn-helix domain-containing protein [Gammaproteobacteria bacterium]
MQTSATPAEKLAAGHLLTDVELSALLGVQLQTIRNWRYAKQGPAFIKLGGRLVRYAPEAVAQFLAAGARP